jgi:hypothetical protein
MEVQSHMNYHLLMIKTPFKNLNLHLFFRSSLTMVRDCNICVLVPLQLPQMCYNFKIVFPSMPVGGVLFKVYIVGESIKVVRRFSLPDVSKRELSKSAGVHRFPRVSCAAASADDADLDPGVAGELACLENCSFLHLSEYSFLFFSNILCFIMGLVCIVKLMHKEVSG